MSSLFLLWSVCFVLTSFGLDLMVAKDIDVKDKEFCGVGKFTRHREPRFEGLTDGNRARLVGGLAAAPGEWPWQATLQLRHPRWGFVGHWCAGVLIHPRWVITGAHCLTNRLFNLPQPKYWTVHLGKYNLRVKEPQEMVFKVSQIIMHDKFREYHNDLALMKLVQPVKTTSDFINTICLPDTNLTRNEKFEGLRCVATGWGRTQAGGRNSDFLQKVVLPVVKNEICKNAYSHTFKISIRRYHICAGFVSTGGKGTCIGDSGGPLQCPIGDGRWYLVGVTSFGSGCAKPGYPDVFIRMTYYLDWIQKIIKTK